MSGEIEQHLEKEIADLKQQLEDTKSSEREGWRYSGELEQSRKQLEQQLTEIRRNEMIGSNLNSMNGLHNLNSAKEKEREAAQCEMNQGQQYESAAMSILHEATRLADGALELSDRVSNKLQPVMMPCTPTCGEQLNKTQREYPPLFEELRKKFGMIESALNSIEYSLSRTEL